MPYQVFEILRNRGRGEGVKLQILQWGGGAWLKINSKWYPRVAPYECSGSCFLPYAADGHFFPLFCGFNRRTKWTSVPLQIHRVRKGCATSERPKQH